jgi:hypothetical protein
MQLNSGPEKDRLWALAPPPGTVFSWVWTCRLRRSGSRAVRGVSRPFAELDSLPDFRVSIRAMRRVALLDHRRS